jgi:hypothetical protein
MLLKFVGGRKALAFYAALIVIFILAWTGKATSEVLGALDTLSLIYIGGNVMKAKVTAKNGGKSNDA